MIGLDFFCGAGGLTKGLTNAGINVLAGIDIDDKCRKTYESNNDSIFWNIDIQDVTIEKINQLFPEVIRNPDQVLIAGCAPCQSFSSQRRSKTERKDKNLLIEYSRIISECLPAWVLMENVPGIFRAPEPNPFEHLVCVLEKNGYSYDYGFLNAKNYGVPQNRRRLVLLASKMKKITLPKPNTFKEDYHTVRKVISHFPKISAGECALSVPNHIAASLTEKNIERLKNTPHDGGDRRNWPAHLVLDCHMNHSGYTDVYGRMFWDKPAPTLTGKCMSLSNGRFGHPEQNRAISLREAAALQSFPDDYVFYGSLPSIAQQIGNAVPVLLGEVLGKHIMSLYDI